MLRIYNSFNNYLIVVYDAKFHVGLFKKGIPSLEDRKVLIIIGYATKHGSQSCDEDPDEFHYTLLDWDKNIRFRKEYIREHGVIPDNDRITQKTLNDFFVLNPYQKKPMQKY